MRRNTLALLFLAFLTTLAPAADWPHWLGPNTNGSSPETGLLTIWPAGGPKVLWKKPGGEGYSTIAVAGGRAITLVQKDAEYVLALDAAKGTELWKQKIAGFYKNSYGNGPRSTPTIDGDFVYVQSVSGPLVCLKADTGDIVWSKDLLKEYGAKNISWGLSASPLVVGDLVYAIPGAKDAGLAAFNKKDGALVWKAASDKAGYATPVAVSVGDKKQIVFFTAAGLVGVTPDKGAELWRMPWKTEFDCNICTPLLIKDRLFVTSGEGVGCGLYSLSDSGEPQEVWRQKGKKSMMTNYWANAVEHDGYLYGVSGQFDARIDLNCVEVKTGKLMWSKEDFGKAALTLADGHLWMTTKTGDLVLAAASPKEYQEKARVKLLGENRTSPTIAGKRMYLRDKENIYCLDIAK